MSEQHDEPTQDVDLEVAPAAEPESEVEATPEVEPTDEAVAEDADETVDAEETPDADETVDAEETPEADETVDAEESDDDDVDAAAADPLAEFRAALHAKVGDWFVVHTYSGMENRVKANLENRITSLNMEDYIHEVVVPTEEVAQIKNGQRKVRTQASLPSYLLVRMDLTNESWSAVRHTPSVTGFVGHSHQPVPLSIDEVVAMLAPAVQAEAEAATVEQEAATSGGGVATTPRKPAVEADFAVSDSVMVVDGPFATLHATITEINLE
ncbi:MAG: transcription termination/antitermination factor NusG, partial [Actinomycetales bacterium]